MREAEAAFAADKTMLLALIEAELGGADALNAIVRRHFEPLLQQQRIFDAIRAPGDSVDTLRRLCGADGGTDAGDWQASPMAKQQL